MSFFTRIFHSFHPPHSSLCNPEISSPLVDKAPDGCDPTCPPQTTLTDSYTVIITVEFRSHTSIYVEDNMFHHLGEHISVDAADVMCVVPVMSVVIVPVVLVFVVTGVLLHMRIESFVGVHAERVGNVVGTAMVGGGSTAVETRGHFLSVVFELLLLLLHPNEECD